MKRTITTTLAVTALGLSTAHSHHEFLKADSITQEFAKFVKQHNKHYDSVEEAEYRERVFRENFINMVKEGTNNNALEKYSPFMDISEAEFSRTHFGFNYDPELEEELSKNSKDVKFIVNLDEDIPTSFNWADKGAVTDIKNQGQCGSCWAFSSTGAIEGQTKLALGELISVSEQELLDCDSVDHGCSGGLMENAFSQLEKIGGIDTEDSYPYETKQGTCRYDKKNAVAKVTGYSKISNKTETIKETLFKKGPLAVALNANSLSQYTGGIYKPRMCLPMINHAVLLTGWGEETDSNGNTQQYWIVKNSWGEDWGENGYFRIARDDKKNGNGTCGIQSHVYSVDIERMD